MNNLFNLAELCLFGDPGADKPALTLHAKALLDQQALQFENTNRVLPISDTVFPEKPRLLAPRDMPRRRMDTSEGKAAFFHALAHIEFVAIYLAWDILYRFRGLPTTFYCDWLRIAAEEAEHFNLIRSHLQGFGVDYGDLPAHAGLWSHAQDTADNLLARLALVPRCMEARGLDVTPGMIAKLVMIGDKPGVDLLTRIYQDEIGHVERGSYWFNTLVREQGGDPEQSYRSLLLSYYKGKPKGPFNREMRIIAGFSNEEIDWLEESLHE